ncbi:MAG: NAD(P)-dependent oxidoreductase [Planctomycetaceae bacterium]|nr:NAD(P)-dependent oxidoreductase [Planctomycetaceae bacterium]MCA9042939.1 NAD(P)-dependent oxidoreductase [Planctomycetaceae bacterium]MCB9950737.1 NAD(P)-dependent oxidoreductase [Planctomycetaceae bacterium]
MSTAKRVCLTGATGFLGRRLVPRLLNEQDVTVRCLVRNSSDVDPLLGVLSAEQQSRIEFVRGDMRDAEYLKQGLDSCDVLYHLAAALGGSTSTLFLNTVVPTRQLLDVAHAQGVGRFVLVSSLGVYGTAGLRNWQQVDETCPLDPQPERRDPYSFSKVRQEQVAREFSQKTGLPLVIVRPGVIFGEGRPLITSRVGLSVGPLLVRMGGSHSLPYTYVENCAEALKLAGLTPGVEGETFNVVDEGFLTGHQLVRYVRRHGQKKWSVWVPGMCIQPLSWMYETYSWLSSGQLPPVITPYRSAAIWKPLRYSSSNAKAKLNWQPPFTVEQSLERTIAG